MKIILVLLASMSILSSCSSSKKATKAAQNGSADSSVVVNVNDGSSYEKAILIDEKTSKKGIDAEYQWLRKHYPGYKFLRQSLSSHNNKRYDVLSIETSDGIRKDIYFDISTFFGKW